MRTPPPAEMARALNAEFARRDSLGETAAALTTLRSSYGWALWRDGVYVVPQVTGVEPPTDAEQRAVLHLAARHSSLRFVCWLGSLELTEASLIRTYGPPSWWRHLIWRALQLGRSLF